MSVITTTAIYEDGILRLLEPLDFPPRQRARITIEAIPVEEEVEAEVIAEAVAEAVADPPSWFPDENPPPQNLNDLLRETPPEYFVEGYSDAGLSTRKEFEEGLQAFEEVYDMSSAEFYEKWQREEMPYSSETELWAALYRDYREDKIMFKDEWPLEVIVGVRDEEF